MIDFRSGRPVTRAGDEEDRGPVGRAKVRDVPAGIWFHDSQLDLTGLVHLQLAHQTIVRLLDKRSSLQPRRAFARDREVEVIDPPEIPEADEEQEARPITAPNPKANGNHSNYGQKLRYCFHCAAEGLAYYNRIAWRCVECGYATQVLHRLSKQELRALSRDLLKILGGTDANIPRGTDDRGGGGCGGETPQSTSTYTQTHAAISQGKRSERVRTEARTLGTVRQLPDL